MTTIPHLEYTPQPKLEPSEIIYRIGHTCDKCPYASKWLFFITNHLKKHSDNKPVLFSCSSNTPELFYCKECDFKTFLFVNFNRHLAGFHSATGVYNVGKVTLTRFSCKNCKFDTYSSLLWELHVEAFGCSTEEHKFQFECDRCFFRTRQKSKFANHTCSSTHKKHKASRKGAHKVKLYHIISKRTAPEEIQWFHCPHCDYKGKVKSSLTRHIKNRHTPPEELHWFQCGHCYFKTKDKRTIEMHIAVKHEDPQKLWQFQCDHCDYKTNYNSNLRTHQATKHFEPQNIQWFRCGSCKFKSKQEREVLEHIRNEHVFKVTAV